MKAWEVLAITVNGELVCPDCTANKDERLAFCQAVEDIAPLFASDATGDETCTRCGEKIT